MNGAKEVREAVVTEEKVISCINFELWGVKKVEITM